MLRFYYILFIFSFLAVVDNLENPYCALSCKQNQEVLKHTVCERQDRKCGPDPKCGPDFKSIEITDQLRRQILNLHNKLRNRVASGNETRGYPGRQPTASNMNVLTYNMELEFIAKCWANSCNGSPLKHDNCRKTKSYDVGQNIAFFNSSSATYFGIKSIVSALIVSWYNEVATFSNQWVGNTQNRGSNVVGHYTQLVWAETKELGCGVTYYTHTDPYTRKKWHLYFLVCNYGPSGNYLGSPVYLAGPSCKGCGKNKGCNSRYTALCGKSIDTSKISKNFNPCYKI